MPGGKNTAGVRQGGDVKPAEGQQRGKVAADAHSLKMRLTGKRGKTKGITESWSSLGWKGP